MRVAVVIPVKNEARGLDTLLARLAAQAGPEDAIVLVDAGSTDATLDIARRRAATDARIRVISRPGAFPGRGRNAGVAATDAPLIAQIDGGNLPNETWLAAITRPLREGLADHVTGDSRAMAVPWRIWGREIDLGPVYQAAFLRLARLREPVLSDTASVNDTASPSGGDSTAYRRELWERAGGQPEWLRSGEDPLFVARLRRLGPRFAFAPQAVSWWQIGPGPDVVCRRLFRQARNAWRGPGRFRRGWRGLAHYPLLAGLLAAAVFFPGVRLPALVWWGLVTARQAAKSLAAYRGIGRVEPGRCSALGAAVLVGLEVPFTLARLLGSLAGLLAGAGSGVGQDHRARAYLDGREGQA